jgi:hypothetical protein
MELTSTAAQTVAANQDVLFSNTAVPGNCSIIHREGSGLATLRGLTEQCRARFRVTFGANIAVPTGGTAETITLALALDGEPTASTVMASTPGDLNDYNCVFSSIFLDVPKGCCMQISVKNTSTQSVLVANANLIVERVA